MIKKRIIAILASFMLVSVTSSSFSFAAAPYKTPEHHEVSDKDAVKFIEKTLGKKYAERALHRVKTPMSVSDEFKNDNYITNSSGNWGGYIARSSNIKGVHAYFNIPSDTSGFIAPWAGIGGVGGQYLAQTGATSGTYNGQTIHAAWIELFPSPAQYVFNVNVGDQMASSVSHDDDTGYWNLLIQDFTTSTYYMDEYNFSPDTSSAEWAVEPRGSNPVGKFSVNFSSCFWNDSSWNFRDINYNTNNLICTTLVDAFKNTAAPSSISGGQSFSISR
ncbi:MAG TPA: G1 family glutamic endopeptidase [Clostridia bacterium]